MHKKIPFVFVIVPALMCVLAGSFMPAMAADFTAEMFISGPGDPYTFKLQVKDPMYRLQKIKGPMNVPPFPTIVNRDSGVTWGLNDQMRQYVEIRDVRKTIMMNPLAGWALTRKGMAEKPGPMETVNGYECETKLYSEDGKSETAAKVWIAKKLNHIIREERFGMNQNPVLELQNIKEGPLDASLFEIPEGYSMLDMSGQKGTGSPDSGTEKSSGASSRARVSSGNIVFILDASGSMWGQVEGKAKIAIAKEVLIGLIKDLPDDAVVGLVAYGHRSKGDCGDVEELVPLSRVDKEKLIKTIQGLSPKGKTPITLSVRMTAEKIRHLEDETTIILVSDGKETCEGDPCALVKELKNSGIKFVMHVIGFDVTEEERIQLECMAEAGGGDYFTARTAGDFKVAAREVVKKAAEKPPVSLIVTAVKDDKPIRSYVQVLTQGAEKRVAEGWTSVEKPASFRLEPGLYDIRAQDLSVIQRPTVDIKDVEIVDGKQTERIVNFATEGILHVKAVKNNAPIKTYVKVFRQKDDKYMRDGYTHEDGKASEFKLLPDMYKISLQDSSVVQRPVIWIEDVEVKAGETTERVATFGSGGILQVKAVKNNAPIKTYVKVFRQKDDKYMRDGYTHEDGKVSEFKLLPDMYKISLQDSSVVQRPVIWIEDVEVKAGETAERVATFGAGGILHVKAVKNYAPVKTYIKVFRQKDNKYMRDGYTHEDGKPSEFKLLPGIYKISLQDGSVVQRPVIWIEDVEVKADQTVERYATFTAGGELKVTATKNGNPYKAYVKIYQQEDSKYMRDGWTREDGKAMEYKLLPGTYIARVEDRTDRSVREIRDIQVNSGKETSVNAAFPVEQEKPALKAQPEGIPAPRTSTGGVDPSSAVSEKTGGDNTVLNGEVPLLDGARVIKEATFGPNITVELEVTQTPEEVIKFYTQAMTDRGWETAMSMVQSGKGACMFKKQGKQLIVNARKRGQKVKVTMGLMSK